MSLISTQDMEQYRQCVDSIDVPDDLKDDVIRIVFNIVCSFVDQAFGTHSAQLSLKDRANPCFSGRSGHAKIASDPQVEAVSLEIEGAINTQKYIGHDLP